MKLYSVQYLSENKDLREEVINLDLVAHFGVATSWGNQTYFRMSNGDTVYSKLSLKETLEEINSKYSQGAFYDTI